MRASRFRYRAQPKKDRQAIGEFDALREPAPHARVTLDASKQGGIIEENARGALPQLPHVTPVCTAIGVCNAG
jgi:hypothetical protein